jgi:hypothetical protein
MPDLKSFFAPPTAEQGAAQQVTEDGDEVTSDPKHLATLLGTDDETARRVLHYVEGIEEYQPRLRVLQDTLPDLGLEGFTDTVLEWLKAILDFLKDVMEDYIQEMGAAELSADWLRSESENLLIMSRERKTLQTGNLEITSRVANLSLRYRPVKDIGSLILALRVNEQVCRGYYKYADQVLGQGVSGLTAIGRNGGNAEVLAQGMLDKSPRVLIGTLLKPLNDQNNAWGSAPLLGNQRLVLVSPDADSAQQSVKQTRLRIRTSEVIPQASVAKFNLPAFNLQQSDVCLKQIITMADVLLSHNKGETRSRRRQRLQDIAKAIEAIMAKVAAGDESQAAALKQTAALLETLADWLVDPFMELYKLTCRNMRAALNVCDLNAQ